MAQKDDATNLIKTVNPKGQILNDNDTGVDNLGHTPYAKALAKTIRDVKTPVTIGVFARWGSGKSFLLKYVCNILKRHQKQHSSKSGNKRADNYRKIIPFVIVLLVTLFLAVPAIVVLTQKSTFKQPPSNTTSTVTGAAAAQSRLTKQALSITALAWSLLVILVAVMGWCCCRRGFSSAGATLKLLCIAAFAKLPVDNLDRGIVPGDDCEVQMKLDCKGDAEDVKTGGKTSKGRRRYIFVHFNAWAYARSDNLWAGIVTNLADAIEDEFGSMTSRLFRLLDVETVSRDSVSGSARLYAKFEKDPRHGQLKKILCDFGVVRDIVSYKVWKKIATGFDGWWMVEYSCKAEAQSAFNYLHKEKITVRLTELSSDENTELSSDENSATPSSKNEDGFASLFRRRPKTALKVPVLYLAILIVVTVAATVISVFACVNSGVITASGDLAKGLAFLPLAVTILFGSFEFVWAMFHSQTSRITTALQGTNSSMAEELGVMDKIKYEVDVITKLIQCTKFSHHKDYKVVITIDDLDRIPLSKVKSVLEAVSILLSDPSSPFVCMIAVDSRIAVKCIEDGLSPELLEDNVNGHEYLKKIINLPFCLPECDQKEQFIDGLVDQSDEARNRREEIAQQNGQDRTDGISTTIDRTVHIELNPIDPNAANHRTHQAEDPTGEEEPLNQQDASQDAGLALMTQVGRTASDAIPATHIDCSYPREPQQQSTTPTLQVSDQKTKEMRLKEQSPREFMFACREFLKIDPKIRSYLHGNPRSIKRIFNVLSLTTVIIKSKEKEKLKKTYFRNEKLQNVKSSQDGGDKIDESKQHMVKSQRCQEFAEELVRWVILTDQWPYRMSYILQVIEDADQRSSAGRNGEEIGNQETLFDIYCNKVCSEINEPNRLLALDGDPDIFFSFLNDLKGDMRKETATRLSRYSVNLDQSLRQTIAYKRSIRDLCMEKNQNDEKMAANPKNKKEMSNIDEIDVAQRPQKMSTGYKRVLNEAPPQINQTDNQRIVTDGPRMMTSGLPNRHLQADGQIPNWMKHSVQA